jgi:hypothetical protein
MILSIANLMEKETTLLNHDNHRCVDYDRNENFIECCKTELDLLLRDLNLTCTIPGVNLTNIFGAKIVICAVQ